MLSWEFIKQNWQSIFTILGAMGGIAIIIKFWSEKISPRLHRFYEWIKSKMPKLVRREELESIKGEVEYLKNAINEVTFRPEIKAFSDEERQKLSISCNPEFGYSFSPYFEFNFEMDNHFDQSFLLDRILYAVHAGDTREKTKYYICEDALLKRIMIKGNNKTTISKVSLVANPDSINIINEKVTGGEHDIDWSINIEAFFEGHEGLKLWSKTIHAITKYNDWKNGNKRWD